MPKAGRWVQIRDGDKRALELYERHYSCYRYADGRPRNRFVGPGERIVLVTPEYSALFVWRRFRDASGQQGVNCSVFRNEGADLSSALIREAERWAWARWPGARLYTYVNPRAVRSSNPGYCFLQAGWRKLRTRTKKRKFLILVKYGRKSDGLRTRYVNEYVDPA